MQERWLGNLGESTDAEENRRMDGQGTDGRTKDWRLDDDNWQAGALKEWQKEYFNVQLYVVEQYGRVQYTMDSTVHCISIVSLSA